MKCNQCGAEVTEHNNFCTQCGNVINTKSRLQETQSSEGMNTEQPNTEQENTEQENTEQENTKKLNSETIKEDTIKGEIINQLNINNNVEENRYESQFEAVATNMDKPLKNKKPMNKKPIIISGILAVLLLCLAAGGIFLQNSKKAQAFDKKVKAFEEYCSTYQLGDMSEEYASLMEEADIAIKNKDKESYKGLKESFEAFKNDLELYQQLVAAYSGKLEEYEASFGKLMLVDEEYTTMIELQASLEEGLQVCSLEQIQEAVSELDDLYIGCVDSNVLMVEEAKSRIDNFDRNQLMATEDSILRQYESNASTYMNDNDYLKAYDEYQNGVLLIEQIEKSWNYLFNVEQVDVSAFPTVKLYVSGYNMLTGDMVKLAADRIAIKELIGGTYGDVTINKVGQLDEKEQLNTSLVADVSGSMYEQMEVVKEAMRKFVDCIQYSSGDQTSLITFDNTVNVNTAFSNSKSQMVKEINTMYAGNSTALYDALYVAICQVAEQEGAKCVIAFTDGYDNVSVRTSDDVISVANKYGVPVYIIGIGYDVDASELSTISDETGGFYQSIDDGKAMEDIYNKIYRENKELYLIEYTSNQTDTDANQELYLTYTGDDCYMRSTASFQPSIMQMKNEDYSDLISNTRLSDSEIEEEVVRIREVYNKITSKKSKHKYDETSIADGVTSYSENGEVRLIVVKKGSNYSDYTRYYYFEDSKLIFAYIEGSDSHRLYFKDDVLFRWRYASDAVKFSEAENHDNEDSADFRTWETFAIDEAYAYYR
ncbi:MAG: VWA domain-containing protein [Clostridiales bacterium]|nr:VWA domain-containing protein [Clostridiales bacterium]